MKHTWRSLVVLALCSFVISACKKKSENEIESDFEVKALKVELKDTTLQVRYVADIQARLYVEIRARQGGILEEILVDEGKFVGQNQTMFKLSSTEYEAQVASARAAVHLSEAELKKAKIELGRVKVLINNNVVTKSELEVAESEVEIAKARLEDAKANLKTADARLGYCKLAAPFSGRLNRINFKRGALIEQGALISTLSDDSEVLAYFDLTEKDYLKNKRLLNQGEKSIPNKVRLELADGSVFNQTGYIETSETEFEENTGVLAMRARFPNPNGLLRHNSTGIVMIEIPQSKAILIPQEAVQEIQDKYFIYLIQSDGSVKLTSFTTSSRVGNYFIVNTGVKPGQVIALEGLQTLKEGQKVTPIFK